MSVPLRMAASAMQNAGTSTKQQVIQVYRHMLKAARQLPSHNHRGLVLQRARSSFRSNASLGAEEANEALQLAHTQLDNLQHQVRHMTEIMQRTNTLTHNAPKPARMYESASAAAASIAPKGTRSFSTTRRTLAEAVAAPSASATAAAAAGAPGAGLASAWMSQSATPAAAAASPAADAASASASPFAAPSSPSSGAATHIVHVRLTNNNTICTLTNLEGTCKCWASSGSVGFKNSKKSTYMACIAAGEQLGLKAKQHNVKNVDMHIAGFHKNKKAVLKGLLKAGINIVAIRDTTPIPFNGCKPKKVRRL